MSRLYILTFFTLSSSATAFGAEQPTFQIQVVDEATGRGVPLVEFETVNSIIHITDNAGNIAFQEPGLINQTVFFHVRSHGYEYPKDGFGFRGVKLEVTPDGNATVKLKRINLAERLYRITGEGLYRDSILLKKSTRMKEPLINAHVVGSDSVVNAVLGGKLHWFWGDTLRPSYPLGNYHVPGATSLLPAAGGLDPAVGIDLQYFKDAEGFAKPTAKMPGKGPTWIFGAGIVRDPSGHEELMTGYMKVEPPLKVYARGVAKFNEQKEEFERVVEFPAIPTLFPEGQTLAHREGDTGYLYFCKPYPHVRVRATPEAFRDPLQYEAYTCLKPGSTAEKPEVERDGAGRIQFAWKANTPAVNAELQKKLLLTKQLKPAEALLRLRDRDTGKMIIGHTGSVNWNAYRQRWVMLCVELHGTSELGEMWYAEADHLLGPWEYAVKIMTHEKYSFYNPKQHPYFDQQDGKVIYFEGTYTQMFSGNPVATPRYEYNQMMYRLDLADPRTALPVPVYQANAGAPIRTKGKVEAPVQETLKFFVLDRPGVNSIPIYEVNSVPGDGWRLTSQTPPKDAKSLTVFQALSYDMKSPPATVTPLYEYLSADGKKAEYSIVPNQMKPGMTRTEMPICLVWKY